jgi:deazaflavin-dependent oxidoreductase (nitroreductase family)
VWVATDDYCYLTTTGRRSGRAHRIEIWYATDGGSLYLLSGGGRSADWVQNILADSSVRVELDGAGWTARARVLDDGGDEEKRARSLVYAKYAPRSQSDLTGWREQALPVALDLQVE